MVRNGRDRMSSRVLDKQIQINTIIYIIISYFLIIVVDLLYFYYRLFPVNLFLELDRYIYFFVWDRNDYLNATSTGTRLLDLGVFLETLCRLIFLSSMGLFLFLSISTAKIWREIKKTKFKLKTGISHLLFLGVWVLFYFLHENFILNGHEYSKSIGSIITLTNFFFFIYYIPIIYIFFILIYLYSKIIYLKHVIKY
jgi:hypothetical protein